MSVSMPMLPPLSLYIHIPWCIRKCPYCDFNSHELKTSREEAYIDALITDFQASLSLIQNRPIKTIFMGGGTPSLFKPESYERLFSAIFQEIDATAIQEITLEANPGTVDEQHFLGYHAIGINRISLGIQSFNAEKLTQLGRIHSGEQAENAFRIARKAGFQNINLDLMFGLPKQTVEEALNDLEKAIDLHPEHLSWYQLTLEPNTVFYKKPPILPNEDLLWEIETAGKQKIQTHYTQYEISAYSQPNKKSKHNLNYWLFGDYLGIGAGAHGKITQIQENHFEITRMQKMRQPEDYMNPDKDFLAKTEKISEVELPFEFMLNALRLYQDIPYDLFAQRTDIPVEKILPILQKAQEKDFLIFDKNFFQVSQLGHQYLNDFQELFLLEK